MENSYWQDPIGVGCLIGFLLDLSVQHKIVFVLRIKYKMGESKIQHNVITTILDEG